jgi:hypothetical protein
MTKRVIRDLTAGVVVITEEEFKRAMLQTVREFVARVEKRIGESYGFGIKGECQAMREELAAMEANDRTND